MEIALRVHVVQRIMSNISGRIGPIFAIFSPYESSLCTDNGFVLFFPNMVNFHPVISEFTLLKRALFAAMHVTLAFRNGLRLQF